MDPGELALLDVQAAMSFSGLLDGCSPQQLLAERMIIIVPHFQ